MTHATKSERAVEFRRMTQGDSEAFERSMPRCNTLKVVLVSASSIAKAWLTKCFRSEDNCSTSKTEKPSSVTIDVYEWRPYSGSDVKCTIWGVHGAEVGQEDSSALGENPAVQSLIFTPRTLYILAWDLECNNDMLKQVNISCLDAGDRVEAERSLRAAITKRAILWLDLVAQNCHGSAVLPVAVIPDSMSKAEINCRCTVFQALLAKHRTECSTLKGFALPELLMGASGNIICVNGYGEANGIQQLQDRMLAAAAGIASPFDHVGTCFPADSEPVYNAIERLKGNGRKFITLDHLQNELGEELCLDSISTALQFIASIGEILYFGDRFQDLSHYVVLDYRWLSQALSSVLRYSLSTDFDTEMEKERKYVKHECLYSNQFYEDHDITKSLIGSFPLLSSCDIKMLLLSSSFMQQVKGRSLLLGESKSSDICIFLEQLLVFAGVFVPVHETRIPDEINPCSQPIYFVPSLVYQEEPSPSMWTYKSSDASTTTLCHSWLFDGCAPINLMDKITVKLLDRLYFFSKCNELPFRIHPIWFLRFKSCIVIRIPTEDENGKRRDVAVFVAMVGQFSPHAVAVNSMDSGMERLIVCGKGFQCGGKRIWTAGYRCIFDSIRQMLLSMPNVKPQVICNDCMTLCSPRSAFSWSWNDVLAASENDQSSICWKRGHSVKTSLLSGKFSPTQPTVLPRTARVKIEAILRSIVLCGIFDPDSKTMLSWGSGFVVDGRAGLVVTSGHGIFEDKTLKPYKGRPNGRAVIAVIPDADRGGKKAVFRYYAKIASHNFPYVDACVLQITDRTGTDVKNEDQISALDQPVSCISTTQMLGQGLQELSMTTENHLEEEVRIAGFNQGGEGLYLLGQHIKLSVDVASGSVCGNFHSPILLGKNVLSSSVPRGKCEIVTTCRTIPGHSGGPCLNSEGEVIGIFCARLPTDDPRSIIVPASEIIPLVKAAQQQMSLTG